MLQQVINGVGRQRLESALLHPRHGGQLSDSHGKEWAIIPECGASSPMRGRVSSSAAMLNAQGGAESAPTEAVKGSAGST